MTTSTSFDKPTSRTPRFLFLSSDKYPPFRVDVDVLFGKEIRARGYKIDWLLQEDERSECAVSTDQNTISWDNWTVFVGPTDRGTGFYNRLRKHYLSFRNDLRAFKLAKQGDYDFIQVKDKFVAALIAIAAAKRAKCDFVYWLSWPFPEASLYAAKIRTARYPLLYKVRGAFFDLVLYRFIATRAKHIFVQSEQMKLDMSERGIDPAKMTAIPMGFEPSSVFEEEALDPNSTAETASRKSEILYLGTLIKTRRLDFLVRVLAEVRKEVKDATLTLVGPQDLPGDAALIETEALRLGLQDAVQLTGRMPRDLAFERVRQASVCVSPFYPTPIFNSTSPTKLIEYFALKKATVANDHPEQRQVLEESGGGICTAYDERAFAEAIIELLNNPLKAKRMGRAGYDYAMKHRTYKALAEGLDQAYREHCL